MEIDCWIDPARALGPQVVALVDGVGLSPHGWQTLPLLINLPSLNYVAATLLAELQGGAAICRSICAGDRSSRRGRFNMSWPKHYRYRPSARRLVVGDELKKE
jgi:hypothetical protein